MGASGFLLETTGRDLRRAGSAGVAGVVLAGLAVVVTAHGVMAGAGLDRLRARWLAETRIVLVLGEPVAAPEDAVRRVAVLPGVAAARYVSPAEALTELVREVALLPAAVNGLDGNPLPARIVVHPSPGLSAAALETLVGSLRGLPGVTAAEGVPAWVGRLDRLRQTLRGALLVFGGGVSVAAFLALRAGAVLARLRRAEEAQVLRLAGVPETALRLPLGLQGGILGLAGGLLGALGVVGSLGLMRATLAAWGLPELEPGLASVGRLLALCLAAGAAGGLAAGLVAGRP